MTADERLMEGALREAEMARDAGEAPIGCLVAHGDEVIASAHNVRETARDPLGHAEIIALRAAAERLGRWRLTGCTLYVTLEPCVMCAGAIVLSRVDRVVYGAADPKAGAVTSLYRVLSDERLNHRPEVTAGVLAERCSAILSDFFRERRAGIVKDEK
ncbi:MAG: tRNA adenosine(34) deaminase TadA [Deltaproteobacteria bacterium]|nr:tRNA adenosine(34) deaminase TadA [Deltaproteobacteria bacterium]